MEFRITFKDTDSALKAINMFELRRKSSISILSGKFKQAREAQRELAKIAVDDFETYKSLPGIKFSNVPLKAWLAFLLKSFGFKIFKLFSKKTPEEKQFAERCKSYAKELRPEDKKAKTIDITIPSL